MDRLPRQSAVALLTVASLAMGSPATMRAHQAPPSATDTVRLALSGSSASADSGSGPVLSADPGIFDSLRIAGLVRRVWYGPVWNDVVVGRLVDSDTDVLILMVRLSETGSAGQRWRVVSQTPAVDSITVMVPRRRILRVEYRRVLDATVRLSQDTRTTWRPMPELRQVGLPRGVREPGVALVQVVRAAPVSP